MKTLATISATFLLLTNVCGQPTSKLDKFRNSDSIVIISHKATAGIAIVDDITGKIIKPPELLTSGKLNNKIVKERKVLDSTVIDQLFTILNRPFEDTVITQGMCFIPQHAILFYKGKIPEYIDICFGCRGFVTSRQLAFMASFDDEKWDQLEGFFTRMGIGYEISLTD